MTSISNIAFIAVLVIIAYCGAWNSVEGRYLPTRGDETRREQMKEVLKVLLDLAPDGREYGTPAEFGGYGRHQAMEKRSIVQPEQVIVPEDSHDSLRQTAAAPTH